MNTTLFEKLYDQGLISEPSFKRIKLAEQNRLFSIHWEIRTILYLGVLMLTGGLGILVYKNIDTIGHQVVLAVIGSICIGSFAYCLRNKLPFSYQKVKSPNAYFDYILLLACLTLLIFIAYLQFQYKVFGEAFGLATFIPMVILFFCAYYFDHLGILSLAITNLAAWMGIAVTPLKIIKENNFQDSQLIFTGLVLGVLLVLLSEFSNRKHIKKHFSFTYLNFGLNVLFISTLAGMFEFDRFYAIWLIPCGVLVYYFYKKAMALGSFYFVLMITFYSFIACGYVVVRLLDSFFELAFYYFIGVGICTVIFLVRTNKKMKHNARIQ